MSNNIDALNQNESLELLATNNFGRLVVHTGDDIDLFPVNYVVNDGKVYFRTAEGTKLASLLMDKRVLFEADEVNEDHTEAWSVIVKGNARILQTTEEIHAAEDLPLEPWLPTLKYNFVEITPGEVSGRKFQLGEEPDRW